MSPLEPLEGGWLTPWLQTSSLQNCERKTISAVLRHPICSHLFQQLETNARGQWNISRGSHQGCSMLDTSHLWQAPHPWQWRTPKPRSLNWAAFMSSRCLKKQHLFSSYVPGRVLSASEILTHLIHVTSFYSHFVDEQTEACSVATEVTNS